MSDADGDHVRRNTGIHSMPDEFCLVSYANATPALIAENAGG